MNNYISALGALASFYVLGEAVSIADWMIAFCMLVSIGCFAYVAMISEAKK